MSMHMHGAHVHMPWRDVHSIIVWYLQTLGELRAGCTRTFVRMYVCMHICMHVCMYA